MINYVDITSFFEWFLTQFGNILTNIIELLDNIKIYNSVTMLDFLITLIIISVFVTIIITLPNKTRGIERSIRKETK